MPAAREDPDYGDVPDRWLSLTGTLAFHAPYSPVDMPGDRAYFSGVRSVAKLVAKAAAEEGARFFPPDLLASFLALDKDEFFYIDRVFQALHWNIELLDIKIDSSAINQCNIIRACQNYVWKNVIGIQVIDPLKDIKNIEVEYELYSGLNSKAQKIPKTRMQWYSERIRFQNRLYQSRIIPVNLQRRGDYNCMIQLFQSAKSGLFLNIEHKPDDVVIRMPKAAEWNLAASRGGLRGQPLSYLVDPNTKLRDLADAASQSQRGPLSCDAEAAE